jgi:SRSO17 transposase
MMLAAGQPRMCRMMSDSRPKPEIALQQLRKALADGVPPAPVLIDPAYGNNSNCVLG